MNHSAKLIMAAAAATVAAAAGGLAWYSGHGAHTPAALPKIFKKTPEPTERFWNARVETVVEQGLSDPYGVAVDAKGQVYLADGGDNNRILRIGADGVPVVMAGGAEGFQDGAGAAASFNTPSGIALDAKGNLYVADTGNHAIRKVAPDGTVTTLAGSGVAGFADGVGAQAQFSGPMGVAVDKGGNVYVADTYNDRIRRIAPDGTVTTLAGSAQPGMADGIGAGALFDTPCGVAVDKDGNVLVADSRNHAVRRIAPDGSVSTLAMSDDADRSALLRRPMALAATADGHIYIATNARGRLLQLTPQGEVGGLPDVQHPANPLVGVDGNVQLFAPRGIALAADGSLLVADAPAQRLHRIVRADSAAATAPARLAVIGSAQAAPGAGSGAQAAPAVAPAADAVKGPMPWPVLPQNKPHEVVGLMGEVRGNYDGDSRDHFHNGLDVQADVGSSVHIVEAAKVTDPLANWAYGNIGEGISIGRINYIHMRVGRGAKDKPLDERFKLLKDEHGKPKRIRVLRGTRFEVGDQVGSVNRMAHVHLDYFRRGMLVNGLTLPFPGLQDTIEPQIRSIALYDADDQKLPAKKGQRLHVQRSLGEVDVVVDAFDQMDGNQARRRLGLYQLGYQLLGADGKPLPGYEQPRITQTYDSLPRNREAVKVVYAPASGITVHGNKETRFAYSLHSTLRNGEVAPGKWNVAELQPGDYTLRIYAADHAGNTAHAGRDLALTIE